MPTILIVEDEKHLARLLALNFRAEGYQVAIAYSAEEAEQFLDERQREIDLIVLDVMLPGTNGYQFCRSLRKRGLELPVVMLTARSLTEDRVRGYESGADAYVVKPFELDELLALVRSQLRRWTGATPRELAEVPQGTYTFGDAWVNFDTFEASVRGKPVKLTALELKLLRYFVQHEGRVLSREELLREVWGEEIYLTTRTVDNFVARLRKHFEQKPSRPKHFLSVRGAGYRFVRQPLADA
jgi:DNA-binding response OmpR family regulator